jgi:acetyl-CoA acetyltransferase
VIGPTIPTGCASGSSARRTPSISRIDLYGATLDDFAAVKVKNARHAVHNPNARFTKEFTADDVASSPVVSDPLRLLEICATSDGGAAIVVSSLDYAKAHGHDDPVRIAGISLQSPTYPDTVLDLPYLASDSAAAVAAPEFPFKDSIAQRAYAEAGIGPDDLDVAEVYDLSSALELDWYEQIGLCKRGEAETLLREGATSLEGRIPVNPSGGLGAFGEAVPAQAIAQVCELTWQLRGQAGARQVEGARTGLSVNQGLFGHGSCVIVQR